MLRTIISCGVLMAAAIVVCGAVAQAAPPYPLVEFTWTTGEAKYKEGPVEIYEGCLDLYGNGLVTPFGGTTAFKYAPIGATAWTPGLDGVRAAIADGFVGGYWNGDVGIRSATAAADANVLTAVGYLDNSYGEPGYQIYTDWRGVDLTQTPGDQVLIGYTYYGDADMNGRVDIDDYGLWSASAGQEGKYWFDGDFDYNGRIDIDDYGLWSSAAGQGVTVQNASVSDAAAVPEPSTLMALVVVGIVGGLCWMRRRRR